MPELGRAALAVTLGLALYATIVGAYAAWRRRRRLAASAQNALLAAFAAAAVASLALVVAFVRRDFSFVYVADHSSNDLPLGYTLSAFWSGQQGSLLLWLLVLSWPLGVALATGAILLALGAGSSVPGLVAYTFSAFVLASIALEFVRGTRARKALGAPTWSSALASLVARNRRRYGGYIVHAAIVLLAIGVAGSSFYQTVAQRQLRPGQTMQVGDYALTYRTLEQRESSNASEARAVLAVQRGDRDLGEVTAGKNSYPVEQQVSNEVAIRSHLLADA